jgi:glutamine amidotransferase
VASSPLQLKAADAIILPGVGNFSEGSRNLEPVRQVILDLVKDDIPVLGICLGLQLFFEESEEGNGKGLALFQGKNLTLPDTVKVPHMGWNTLDIITQNDILEGVPNGSFVYFVHSCYPAPLDRDVVCAETTYGVTFASAIAARNVYGTQFHPEKSGKCGLKILSNFARIVGR